MNLKIFTVSLCVLLATIQVTAVNRPIMAGSFFGVKCLYQRDSNGYCGTGFESKCRFSFDFSVSPCHLLRVNEAKKNCASHRLDSGDDRNALFGGCYFGGPTCYCEPVSS